MIKRTLLTLVAALIIALLSDSISAFALSDHPVWDVYNAGKGLLFEVHNVTVSGNAVFSLDGIKFKHVNAVYKQDNENSRWQYDLTSPREFGLDEEYESGYSTIVNGSTLYLVDKHHPGTYRIINAIEEQNTPVRRSFMMDQAINLTEIALKAAEPLLDQSTVKVAANDQNGTTLKICLKEADISMLGKAAFNSCVQMVIQRVLVATDFDTLPTTYEEYFSIFDFITPAEAIVRCTKRYDPQKIDVTVSLDGEDRLINIAGSMSVVLVLADGIPEAKDPNPHVVDVAFDVIVSDYNTTSVPAFNPDAEGLEPKWGYTDRAGN